VAGPAQADSYLYTKVYQGGEAVWVSNGDHLYIYDLAADGKAVAVKYIRQDSGTTTYIAWNTSGSGSVVDHHMDLVEGSYIEYSVCLGTTSNWNIDEATCSNWRFDYA
jgi:hypothetical protein